MIQNHSPRKRLENHISYHAEPLPQKEEAYARMPHVLVSTTVIIATLFRAEHPFEEANP